MKQNVRTTERMAIILFLILLLLVVYQNCGVPVKVQPGVVRKLAESDLSSLQQMLPEEKKMVCESSSFYTCTHKMLSPDGVDDGAAFYTKCFDLTGAEEAFCASVSLVTGRSVEVYEEVRCHNHVVGIKEDFPVFAQKASLENAVTAVMALCRETLKY